MTMGQDNRAQRSVVDHRNIVDALRRREPDLAERLVREHTLGLAAHVETHGDSLDRDPTPAEAGAQHRRRTKAGRLTEHRRTQ